MASGGLIAALIGAGAGAAVVLLTRKSEAAPASSGGSICDKLPAGSTEQAACKGIGGILGIVSGVANALAPQWGRKDDENIAKNGARVHANAGHCGYSMHVAGRQRPLIASGTLRHANGCVPYEGAPGWEKCAPGTHSMWDYPSARVAPGQVIGKPGSDMTITRTPSLMLTGKRVESLSHADGKVRSVTGDPTTFVINPKNGGTCGPFPLAIPAGGVGGYYKGHAFVCPAGTLPDLQNATDPSVTKPVCRPPSQLPPSQGGTGKADSRPDHDAAEGCWVKTNGTWTFTKPCPTAGPATGTVMTLDFDALNPLASVEQP